MPPRSGGRRKATSENGIEATTGVASSSSSPRGDGVGGDDPAMSSGARAVGNGGGGAGGSGAGSGSGSGSGGSRGVVVGDRLVKKTLQLNQLAVYWNPADSGNPCSMDLSDIPVDQAEVVISRCGGGGWWR